ncbi:MAG: cupin domain-containing protein [Lachnospiraceae bacterium]|jgi:mannose-6-phosphate isomerase-like protein (cupin superfamily)
MVRKTMKREASNIRGGKGTIYFDDIITKEEFNGHGSSYTKVTMPAGTSIGYHQHVDNTEQYYILSGNGTFLDTDGSRVEVGPGDVCYIEVGQSHGMENNSDADLVMMALIYNKKAD